MDIDDAKRNHRSIAKIAAENNFDQALAELAAQPETQDPSIRLHRQVLRNIIETASGTKEPPYPSEDVDGLFCSRNAPGRPMWILMGWTGSMVPKTLAARLFQQKECSLVVAFDRVKKYYARSRSTEQVVAEQARLGDDLKKLIDEWQPGVTIFVGQSRFTFAAALAAVRCNGDRVVLPSALTEIDTGLLRMDPGSKARELVSRMRDIMPPETRDCKEILKDWVQQDGHHLHLVYTTQQPRDEKQSARMSFLPNTTLTEEPYWPGHDILPYILGTELMDRIASGEAAAPAQAPRVAAAG